MTKLAVFNELVQFDGIEKGPFRALFQNRLRSIIFGLPCLKIIRSSALSKDTKWKFFLVRGSRRKKLPKRLGTPLRPYAGNYSVI